MPVASYLAYPMEGQGARLQEELSSHPHCEVVLAENAELLILLTDTPGWEEEQALHDYLSRCEGLMCLAMTYGEIDEAFAPGVPDAEAHAPVVEQTISAISE